MLMMVNFTDASRWLRCPCGSLVLESNCRPYGSNLPLAHGHALWQYVDDLLAWLEKSIMTTLGIIVGCSVVYDGPILVNHGS